MASRVKAYKGHVIKKTSKNDNTTYKYWVINPKWSDLDPVWEADTIKECEEWVDSE